MPPKLSQRLAARASKARRSIDAANIESAERLRKKAYALVSGNIPKAILDEQHPFSRDGHAITAVVQTRTRPNSRKKVRFSGRGSYPLTPINAHSNRLRNSLRVFKTRNGFRIQFTASYSKYVLRTGGTKFMVDREFWKQMQKYSYLEKQRMKKKVAKELKQKA